MFQDQIGEFTVFYENELEFRGLVREIFRDSSYYFETQVDSPIILDIGAHIGLSTLYFKKLYPRAKVFAIEPNPQVFELLKTNLDVNHLEDVMPLPVAVSDQHGKREFYLDLSPDKWQSTAGFQEKAWDETDEDNGSIMVETVKLEELIHGPIDLVKMDVEGAEQAILESSAEALNQVKHIIFEYHPIKGNNLHELGKYLKDLGFHLSVFKHGDEVPFHKARGLVMVEAIQVKEYRK